MLFPMQLFVLSFVLSRTLMSDPSAGSDFDNRACSAGFRISLTSSSDYSGPVPQKAAQPRFLAQSDKQVLFRLTDCPERG